MIGMQQPEKYKENFDGSSGVTSSGVTSRGRENYMSFYTKSLPGVDIHSE